nr:late competence development ComFB family protein [uncultured Oscillibacter sp.]
MASNNSSKTAHVMNLLSKNRGSAPEPPAEPKAEPAAPQAEPAPQAAPAQEAPAAPVREDAPQEPFQEEEEQPSYINVMQILVEEKADEYMKMFGICCCDKCRVDVRAYALNHLPPKYVVLSQNERVPRLTVYESRFASDVTSQLIQACKKVMLTPHHSRPEN